MFDLVLLDYIPYAILSLVSDGGVILSITIGIELVLFAIMLWRHFTSNDNSECEI